MLIELFSKMKVSDVVSIAPLLISILIGYINYLYTKRTFAAAYYPRIQITPKMKNCSGGNCLSLKIKNLSNSFTMTDLYISVFIQRPKRFLFFIPNRIKILERRISSLYPLNEESFERIPDVADINLEDLLVKNFSDWIQAKTNSLSGRAYHLQRNGNAWLIIRVKYTPGVMGAHPLKDKAKFVLVPHCNVALQKIKPINSWDIEN